MSRTATVRARLEPDLKEDVEKLLRQLGISTRIAGNAILRGIGCSSTSLKEGSVVFERTGSHSELLKKQETTQMQYVLKALHNLAHGKAMGTNENGNPCPVGATQENNKRGCVAPIPRISRDSRPLAVLRST